MKPRKKQSEETIKENRPRQMEMRNVQMCNWGGKILMFENFEKNRLFFSINLELNDVHKSVNIIHFR